MSVAIGLAALRSAGATNAVSELWEATKMVGGLFHCEASSRLQTFSQGGPLSHHAETGHSLEVHF
jgi:hypothetical protein